MGDLERVDRTAQLLSAHQDAPTPDLSDVAWEGDLPLLDATVAGLASNYVSGRKELSADKGRIALECARELDLLAARLSRNELEHVRRLREMVLLVGGSETVS